MKEKKGLIGMGLLTALASSLCCITPVLAIFAGSSGMASSFSWMEPARPYLIIFTIIVLGFAWYQKLKPVKQDNCECDPVPVKKGFFQTNKFLGIVTVFAIIMTAFPYYAYIFYKPAESKLELVLEDNLQFADYNVSGMTCDACTDHIIYAVSQLPGYYNASANYENGTAHVEFDKTLTSEEDVITAINETGYKVIE